MKLTDDAKGGSFSSTKALRWVVSMCTLDAISEAIVATRLLGKMIQCRGATSRSGSMTYEVRNSMNDKSGWVAHQLE